MEFLSLNIEYIILLIYRILTGEQKIIPRDFFLFWDEFKIASTIISLLLLTGIVYSVLRLSQIGKEEKEKLHRKAVTVAQEETVELRRDERWERVLENANSDNQNDWRQAIIEADSILDDIVTKAGYPGETLGERLRGIEKGEFRTLDEAWEAHKIRNRIAHDGGAFQLNKREVLRVIHLYQKVFEEFFYL